MRIGLLLLLLGSWAGAMTYDELIYRVERSGEELWYSHSNAFNGTVYPVADAMRFAEHPICLLTDNLSTLTAFDRAANISGRRDIHRVFFSDNSQDRTAARAYGAEILDLPSFALRAPDPYDSDKNGTWAPPPLDRFGRDRLVEVLFTLASRPGHTPVRVFDMNAPAIELHWIELLSWAKLYGLSPTSRGLKFDLRDLRPDHRSTTSGPYEFFANWEAILEYLSETKEGTAAIPKIEIDYRRCITEPAEVDPWLEGEPHYTTQYEDPLSESGREWIEKTNDFVAVSTYVRRQAAESLSHQIGGRDFAREFPTSGMAKDRIWSSVDWALMVGDALSLVALEENILTPPTREAFRQTGILPPAETLAETDVAFKIVMKTFGPQASAYRLEVLRALDRQVRRVAHHPELLSTPCNFKRTLAARGQLLPGRLDELYRSCPDLLFRNKFSAATDPRTP